MGSKKTGSAPVIAIDRVPSEHIRVPIIGTAPLILHRFSDKARRQMLDKQQSRMSPPKNRDPQAEYEAAFHRLKNGAPGFPASGFKQATVGAGRFYRSVTMAALKQFLFFVGEPGADRLALVQIYGEPTMREDVVRIARTTDLRYRPMFAEWSAHLDVIFVPTMVTRGSVLSLIDAGGLGVGVGEWRPEKDGEFGTYKIDPTKDIEVFPS